MINEDYVSFHVFLIKSSISRHSIVIERHKKRRDVFHFNIDSYIVE